MIRTTAAILLAKSKFHTKRRLTILSLSIASILLGVLMTLTVISHGLITNLNKYVKKAGGEKYQVSVRAIIPSNISSSFDNLDHTAIDNIRLFEKQYRTTKAEQYRLLGLKYNESEDAPALRSSQFAPKGEPEKYRVEFDDSSPIAKKLINRRYEEWAKTAKNKTQDLLSTVKKYGTPSYYSNYGAYKNYLNQNNSQIIINGREILSNWVDNKSMYSGNSLKRGYYAGVNDKLVEKYITYHGKLKGIPVVVSVYDVADLFGDQLRVDKKPPSDNTARAEWLKEVQHKANGFTYQVCYRNAVERTVLTKIQQAGSDTSNEKINNLEGASADGEGLYYRLPTIPCGDIVAVADRRTAEQKNNDLLQNIANKKLGITTDLRHRLITMQIVGISNEKEDQTVMVNNNIFDMARSVLKSSPGFGGTTLVPNTLYLSTPNDVRADNLDGEDLTLDVVAGLSESTSKQFPYGMLEFSSAEQARNFLANETCNTSNPNCGKAYEASQYGVNFLVLDDLINGVNKIISIIFVVVASLVAIIIWLTISRIISESRRETAVYRAVGARRIDIALVYLSYAIMLSLIIIAFAFIIATILSVIAAYMVTPYLLVAAQASFGIIGSISTVSLVELNDYVLVMMLWMSLLIVAISVLSAIQPIVRNTRREPANDLVVE